MKRSWKMGRSSVEVKTREGSAWIEQADGHLFLMIPWDDRIAGELAILYEGIQKIGATAYQTR